MKYILIVLILLTSCSKDEIKTFDDTNHIYFKSIHKKHEYKFSFLYTKDNKVSIKLPVAYFGKKINRDRLFRLEVDQSSTTAKETEEYSFDREQRFRAGLFEDSVEVTLLKSERLNDSEQNLTIKLVANEHFQTTVRDSLVMKILFTNKVSQPLWWNKEVEIAYLGTYSDKKYLLFIDNIYTGDFGILSESEKLHYARMFKNWLAENPHYENGVLITVPVIG